MRQLHIAPPKLTQQFPVVIARHAERATRSYHVHHQTQHGRRCGTTINEITQEDHFAPLRMAHLEGCTMLAVGCGNLVIQALEQLDQFVEATMHVSDDIEGTMLVLKVAPKP